MKWVYPLLSVYVPRAIKHCGHAQFAMATINIGYVTVSWMTSLVHTVATKKFSQDTTHLKFAILKKWKSGTNNYLLAYPDSILSSYNKIIWWNCPKNHQYSMSLKKKLYYRMRGQEPCPYCKGRRRNLSHFF